MFMHIKGYFTFASRLLNLHSKNHLFLFGYFISIHVDDRPSKSEVIFHHKNLNEKGSCWIFFLAHYDFRTVCGKIKGNNLIDAKGHHSI